MAYYLNLFVIVILKCYIKKKNIIMEENLSKWDGFLNNLSDEDVKTKLINAFEILSNVLMKANELDPDKDIKVFAGLRRIMTVSPVLDTDIELTEEKISNFRNYIYECCDTTNYEKYISSKIIDIDAEIFCQACSMYVEHENKQHILKK
jgi:hypothetical protein